MPVPDQVKGLLTAVKKLSPDQLKKFLDLLKPPAPVPKTGNKWSDATGDDGSLQKGVPWPVPRFTDNNNGTVTDNLTGLVWTKNADRFNAESVQIDWYAACEHCRQLADDGATLTDGSQAGDWRLPNLRELQSLVHYGINGDYTSQPVVPDTAGTGVWTEGNPFNNVRKGYSDSYGYWSSTALEPGGQGAWQVHFGFGLLQVRGQSGSGYVWCVRDRK